MQAENTSSEETKTTKRRRGGRPSVEQVGEVDRRILDAAHRLFLRLGFEATSCEQIAVEAGAGKASIYARYANKEEVFAAVVRRNVEGSLAPSGEVPLDLPLHARLRAVGHSILTHALRPEIVAFMRVVMTTAYRLPDLTVLTDRIGRDRGVRRIAEAIVGDASREADALEAAMPVAAKFIEITFVPHQMRALVGDDPGTLEADALRRVDEAIHLLSKGGWLDRWESPA
ncbi:TetR/AcrR family transcriptional regulator [Lichenihabitans sp. PAMC28606]|uniref:TetR/AcrR family transcriptional regulator n=1 Tax=Lichenihabitans sp. PAMC28606 TaxID=2880932 RepID=UPI001D0A2C05|nr:TetR/AcrR family transcriptional regulator [Lichenihabitans sp. PAMC28606]UDL96465.1 TetR/AcrR family transcriptional regulator [Lichenihabitans sp. PAMC28606]